MRGFALGYASGMTDRIQVHSDRPAAGETVSPSLTELAVAFGTIGASGFGGVLPWARRVLVEQRRWLTPEAFNELFALCNSCPGPNIVNLAAVFGSRARGPAGAFVAVAALIGPPVVIVIGLGALYARYGEVAAIRRVLAGLAAAAAGLLVAVAVKMCEPLIRSRKMLAIGMAAVTFVAVGVAKMPLIWAIVVLCPVSVALAWGSRA